MTFRTTGAVLCKLLLVSLWLGCAWRNVDAGDESAKAAAPKPAKAVTKVVAKPSAKPSDKAASPTPQMSEKRRQELAVTLAKRKAAANLKRARAMAKNAEELKAAQAAYEAEVKLAPYRLAAQNEAIRQQSTLNSLQLQQQQSVLNNQEAVLNRQRQILLQRLSGGGIVYGPNGPMLPGEQIQVQPQAPSLGGLPVIGP